MDDSEFRLRLKIEGAELDLWIQHGWLHPQLSDDQRRFRDADLARARLIVDLMQTMEVNEAGVEIVLELIDQLHGVRRAMRDLVDAVRQEDPAVQQRLRAAMERLHDLD